MGRETPGEGREISEENWGGTGDETPVRSWGGGERHPRGELERTGRETPGEGKETPGGNWGEQAERPRGKLGDPR